MELPAVFLIGAAAVFELREELAVFEIARIHLRGLTRMVQRGYPVAQAVIGLRAEKIPGRVVRGDLSQDV